MPEATALIPTHDHGPTLYYSVGSVLAQSVEDIEIFIVGDGVPDSTREIVAELQRDERVRFFDNPKGESRGERHRHAALREARSEIICYLSDDDLWLPDHVATMRRLLQSADFANALPLRVDETGEMIPATVDLSRREYRELLLSGTNRVPLSGGSHTLEMYRRLPFGWRTTPEGTPTDLYMWQQFLAEPHCRAVSGTRPTVINFPSSMRQERSLKERLEELRAWSESIADLQWRTDLPLEVLDRVVRRRAADVSWLGRRLENHKQRLHSCQEMSRELKQRQKKLRRQVKSSNSRLTQVRGELARERERAQAAESELQWVRRPQTWRLLDGVNRIKLRILGRR